jgi:hypothetical protein
MVQQVHANLSQKDTFLLSDCTQNLNKIRKANWWDIYQLLTDIKDEFQFNAFRRRKIFTPNVVKMQSHLL